jgi:hypothetical protein
MWFLGHMKSRLRPLLAGFTKLEQALRVLSTCRKSTANPCGEGLMWVGMALAARFGLAAEWIGPDPWGIGKRFMLGSGFELL